VRQKKKNGCVREKEKERERERGKWRDTQTDKKTNRPRQ
jgi:hypothetical protein